MIPMEHAPLRAYRRSADPDAAASADAAVALLRAQGYVVLSPAEQRPMPHHGEQQPSIYATLLTALYRRHMEAARTSPSDPASLGLTTLELAELTAITNPQRRLSELRLCGLVTSIRDDHEWWREHQGEAPQRLSFITSAGASALRVIAPAVVAQAHHPARRAQVAVPASRPAGHLRLLP